MEEVAEYVPQMYATFCRYLRTVRTDSKVSNSIECSIRILECAGIKSHVVVGILVSRMKHYIASISIFVGTAVFDIADYDIVSIKVVELVNLYHLSILVSLAAIREDRCSNLVGHAHRYVVIARFSIADDIYAVGRSASDGE